MALGGLQGFFYFYFICVYIYVYMHNFYGLFVFTLYHWWVGYRLPFFLAGLPFLIIETSTIQPYQRGFYCDDDSIRYPLKSMETINDAVLCAAGILIAILAVSTIFEASSPAPWAFMTAFFNLCSRSVLCTEVHLSSAAIWLPCKFSEHLQMKAGNGRNKITLEAHKQAQSCLGKSGSSARAFSPCGRSSEQKQKELSVSEDLAWFVPIQITLGICLFYKVEKK